MIRRTRRSVCRRLAGLLVPVLLLALFSGCSSDPSGKIFRYDIAGPVSNLDPQFATEDTARLVLMNLYEGLVVQSADGEILPGVATGYEISEDRLLYRFTLRENAAWTGGDPVTAQDFVFAFQRMFRDKSPNAKFYGAIRGAGALLDGGGDLAALAVRATGDYGLEIELEHPDPQFLQRLADPAAAPCNEKAFLEARGRYGMETDLVCCNGPFKLNTWEDSRLLLRRNEDYRSERETVAGGVNFYVGREAAQQFLDGKTDLALLGRDQQEQLSGNAETHPIQRTVWCVVFNQNSGVWGNPLVRQGLAYTVDHELMGETVPASFQPATQLVPPAMRVMGKPYRELAGQKSPIEYDTVEGERLFHLGLGMLGMDQLPGSTTINIPEEARELLNVGQLQQGWQRDLAAYINFEVTTASQIQSNLRTGNYDMMIMPFTPADSNVRTLLDAFGSTSAQNYFGYNNVVYDELLETAAAGQTPEAAAARYAQAETTLLSDAVVIPLYYETTYLAVAGGVRNLEVSPFGDRVSFKYAEKDG